MMKLEKIYRKAVAVGIKKDPRGAKEVRRVLAEAAAEFKKQKPDELEFFDRDRLFNPYHDTRILAGDPGSEVRAVMVGIDMEAAEVLLADRLRREHGRRIDCVIAHHPEGYALARLHEVMKLQTDQLAALGVNVSVAERLMEKRISEVERRLMPVNHERAVDAARLLGMSMMCIHTPADNCVTSYLDGLFKKRRPATLRELLAVIRSVPEYRRAALRQVRPKIINGSDDNRCGRVFVDMTGGTEGSKDVFDKLAAAGVSTIVCMHMSEEALEKARKADLNVVIAGHVASDSLGLNLLFDELEKEGKLEFVCASGFERIRASERA
jgi:putative NIF3 family GTP cyclohydrolase 1 type 2